MGNFNLKVDKFINIFIEQNGYVKVVEGLRNTLLIAVVGLLYETYHHGRVEFAVGVYAHDAGVESALVCLRLVYYLAGLLLRRTRYASGRQLRSEYVADTLRVVGGQLAAYLRTCLQDVALVGVQNVNETKLLHLHVRSHRVQVVAYKVDNGGVLCCLLLVVHQHLLGIGQRCVDGALHRERIDSAASYLHERFGREAHKTPYIIRLTIQEQLVLTFRMAEDVFKREVAMHRDLACQIGEIAIACQHIVLHDIEATLVFVVLRCPHLPFYLRRQLSGASADGVCMAAEVVEALAGIYLREFLYIRLVALIVDNKQKGFSAAAQLIQSVYYIFVHTFLV